MVEEFIAVAHRIVWCTVATVDRHNRPRSRILHPIWTRPPAPADDAITGWITTRPTPLKVAHLSHKIWPDGPADPDAGVLRLTPWRIRVAGMQTLLGQRPPLTWTAPDASPRPRQPAQHP